MPQQRRRSGPIIGLLSIGLLIGTALTADPAQSMPGSEVAQLVAQATSGLELLDR